ncbi:MAG: serpin family protein [Cyanobacteria bacterium SBC]|nr:serpin family protein [Cyanobacteria bacterium SBC]
MTRKTFSMWRWILLVTIGFAVGGMPSQGGVTPPRSIVPAPEIASHLEDEIARWEPTMQQLTQANANFGFLVFSRLAEGREDENLALSPTSLSMALTLLYRGARSQTQQQMTSALGYAGLSLEELDRSYGDLFATLAEVSPDVELNIANSVWAGIGETLESSFVETSRTIYRARVDRVNFSQPQDALQQINRWVAAETNDRIEEILSPSDLDRETVIVLANALYFLGYWTYPFSEEETRLHPFTLPDGTQKQHPMMVQQMPTRYCETALFKAVELPYGESERMSLYAFVPKPGKTLADFYQHLTLENWNIWMNSFDWYSSGALVKLPKFRLDDERELNEVLKSVGLGGIFETPDFSGIVPQSFAVSLVKQKTYIDVNEKGTEATAATAIVGTRSSPPEIEFDRPFFFAIRDNDTGAILFLGSVADPTL